MTVRAFRSGDYIPACAHRQVVDLSDPELSGDPAAVRDGSLIIAFAALGLCSDPRFEDAGPAVPLLEDLLAAYQDCLPAFDRLKRRLAALHPSSFPALGRHRESHAHACQGLAREVLEVACLRSGQLNRSWDPARIDLGAAAEWWEDVRFGLKWLAVTPGDVSRLVIETSRECAAVAGPPAGGAGPAGTPAWEIQAGLSTYRSREVPVKGRLRYLLDHFVRRGGRPVTLDQIKEVCGDPDLEDSTARGYVSQLRRALRDHLADLLPAYCDPIPCIDHGAYGFILL